MDFIIFGKFSFNHIYFLFYALCTLLPQIFRDILYKNKNTISQNFYSMYIEILSRFLAIIPYSINKKLSKSNKEKSKQSKISSSELEVNYIYYDITKDLSTSLMKSILKVCIFEFLAIFLICIFYFINDKPEVIIIYPLQIYLIINTINQYLVSHFVLNYQFYKHHYLSFGINIFCTLFFLITDIIEIVDRGINDYQYYIYVLMRLIRLLLLALEDNYAKHALYTQFLSPFSLMVYMAIIETIFLLIISIPFIFIKTSDTNQIIFVDFIEYLQGSNLFLSFVILLSNFLFQTFILVIIDRFSPSHLPLGFIIYSFCSNIYKIIKNAIYNEENEWFLFTNFVLYIILFIGAMIHNEIFIINKWGFNKDTKLFLTYKLKEEKSSEDEEEDDAENAEDKPGEKFIPLKEITNQD